MRSSKHYFLISLIFLAFHAFASDDESPSNGYYIFPIQPGQNNFLAGTMGELRAAHFHGGIDIKTGGREGLNVYSAADGYVSRVKVSTNGYGNALYITHPNGETTVYAHLLQFEKNLANWVRKNQYEKKSFSVDLWPEKNQFTYKQGDVVALSGNTGGSSGPHLHFEIRDAMQRPVNPLRYNFKEIIDNIPPIVQKLAIECLSPDARINGRYGRFEYNVIRKGSNYVLSQPVKVYGKVGIELLAHDKLNGAGNKNGIPIVDLLVNDQKIYSQNLASFSFAESRNILVHTNYRIKKYTGRSYNKLYIDDGDELGFYDRNLGDGVVAVYDGEDLDIEIRLEDAYANQSKVNFQIFGDTLNPEIQVFPSGKTKKEGSKLFNHTLILSKDLRIESSQLLEVFSERIKHTIAPDYIEGDYAIYIWDMTKGLPDSVDRCHSTEQFNFQVAVPPYHSFDFYNSKADIHFPKRCLFDTLYLQMNHEVDTMPDNFREVFHLAPVSSPFRQNIRIQLKPDFEYADQEKTHVYSMGRRNSYNFVGGQWEDNKINFRTRDLGKFTLLKDSISPQIRVVRQNKDMTSFIIKDELSGIKSFNAYINNTWVLMNYDYKKNLIWSEKLDNRIPFEGEFKLEIVDNAGNVKTYKTNL